MTGEWPRWHAHFFRILQNRRAAVAAAVIALAIGVNLLVVAERPALPIGHGDALPPEMADLVAVDAESSAAALLDAYGDRTGFEPAALPDAEIQTDPKPAIPAAAAPRPPLPTPEKRAAAAPSRAPFSSPVPRPAPAPRRRPEGPAAGMKSADELADEKHEWVIRRQ